ncbi:MULTISPECIES: response regulator [unclassified Flavobacterium]|jgi:DNA-binding NarL/FixJ family response regulator|uniref:response regulator n=1 Tax=unclassified Flavobacterium TaxID=196869 RepID=UPI00057CA8D7|nr:MULTISPECIES: response regulator [unclassified Flavobacterium]KIA95302.1 response regulator receiver protein [Flavobacterium sp. KMS]KIC00718.1 response regulator receiver protein [Flavobacterium sp. JRM]MEA9415816.1 response regulator [Flavobacterium sp. PL02]
MNTSLTILIVDDHPMTVDSYINLLSGNDFQKNEPTFIKSYNCEEAYNKIIFQLKQNVNIDFALLDISLPPYKEFNIDSGIDLAILIREKFPNCKIVLLTMHSEPLTVDKIIKGIKPEGFISKSDIDFESFPSICKKIIEGEIFLSNSIIKSQRKLFKKNINWDNHDNQILILISQGVKTVNLPDYIPLSMSAIEKRKANIKDQLLKGKGSDKDLIEKAKKLGLL